MGIWVRGRTTFAPISRLTCMVGCACSCPTQRGSFYAATTPSCGCSHLRISLPPAGIARRR
eukprot:2184360-Pyramimonas_sp.AAC.1